MTFETSSFDENYRNEISPKSFVRLREFTQVEIEYFFDPSENQESLMDLELNSLTLPLYTVENQMLGEDPSSITIKDALSKNIICRL